jgi:hypothetical protein
MEFKLNKNMIEELKLFTQLLKKDHNTILEEALSQYFENEQKKLLEKRLDDENAMTNLDFDEFWDGVDI